MTFILLAVLNILTGIFVESAIAVSRADFEGHIAEVVEQEQAIADVFQRLFNAIDYNHDDELPYEEFAMHMNLPSFWAYFEVLGLDIVEPRSFYAMLCDIGTTKAPDMESFVKGCRKLRGPAKQLDLYGIKLEVHGIGNSIKKLESAVVAIADRVASSISL